MKSDLGLEEIRQSSAELVKAQLVEIGSWALTYSSRISFPFPFIHRQVYLNY